MARLTRVASSAFSCSQRASSASLPAWASCRSARAWPSSVRSSSFSRAKLQARHSASWCRRVSAARSRARQPNLTGRQAERLGSRGSPSTPPRQGPPPLARARTSRDPGTLPNLDFCALDGLQKGEAVRVPLPPRGRSTWRAAGGSRPRSSAEAPPEGPPAVAEKTAAPWGRPVPRGACKRAREASQPRPRPSTHPPTPLTPRRLPSTLTPPAHPEAPPTGRCASSRSRSCSSEGGGKSQGRLQWRRVPQTAAAPPLRPSSLPRPRPYEGGAPLTSLQEPPQPAPASLPRPQFRPHVLPPAPAPHGRPPQRSPGLAVRPFQGLRGRRRGEDGGRGGGGSRGGRLQPRPDQRAAAAAGGAGAGDRGGAAERRHGDPGAVEGEAERAAAGPAGGAVRGLRAEGGGGALGPDPLPDAGGHPAAARGLQLRGAQGLPDGPAARRLRPPQAGRAGPRLRADAGAAVAPSPLPAPPRQPPKPWQAPLALWTGHRRPGRLPRKPRGGEAPQIKWLSGEEVR